MIKIWYLKSLLSSFRRELYQTWYGQEPEYERKPLKISARTARKMPDLHLPPMPPMTRNAFRTLVRYQGRLSNDADVLKLAEARGFAAHPEDWVPSPENGSRLLPLYLPWAYWLAERGLIPYWEGIPLTAENWKRWTKEGRQDAFYELLRNNRTAAFDLLLTLGTNEPPAIRRGLLNKVGAGAMFYGNYPEDVPILNHFLQDPSPEVSSLAREKLDRMEGLETEEAHAALLARFFVRQEGSGISVLPELYNAGLMRNILSTSPEALAGVLGVTPEDFANEIDIDGIKDWLSSIFARKASQEMRDVLARRAVEAGKTVWIGSAGDPATWEKRLRATFSSVYPSVIFEFLGPKVGTLDIAQMREVDQRWHMGKSITNELQTGNLPVNTQYDPLRVLGLLASKEAAGILLQEALDLGARPDNPRLTMLRFNVTL